MAPRTSNSRHFRFTVLDEGAIKGIAACDRARSGTSSHLANLLGGYKGSSPTEVIFPEIPPYVRHARRHLVRWYEAFGRESVTYD